MAQRDGKPEDNGNIYRRRDVFISGKLKKNLQNP
jgi:hypothetical protein